MTVTIKYKLKSRPKPIEKVSDIVISIGILLLLVGNLFYTPFKSLPLELQVFAFAEFIPNILFDFDFITISTLFLGLILIPFKWRNGKIHLDETKIEIQGNAAITILLNRINEIDIFDANHGVKRTVQFGLDTDVVKIKFRTEEGFYQFSERLVNYSGQFDNIKLKTWTD